MLQGHELQELLYKELQLLEELNGLSLQKKEALLNDDLISLETIVLKEEALSKKLHVVDDACSPQVKFFLRVLKSGSPNKLADPKEEETLELVRKIRETAFRLQRNNEFNQTLISDALSLIQFKLNILVPSDKANAPVYGASGKMERRLKKTNLLDCKR